MENKQLTPTQAFEVIFQMTGQLQLNRQDSTLLDSSLRALAQLLPVEQKEDNTVKND